MMADGLPSVIMRIYLLEGRWLFRRDCANCSAALVFVRYGPADMLREMIHSYLHCFISECGSAEEVSGILPHDKLGQRQRHPFGRNDLILSVEHHAVIYYVQQQNRCAGSEMLRLYFEIVFAESEGQNVATDGVANCSGEVGVVPNR